ncbi:MAG: hypothetical protein EAZ99_06450 [Alphaproteobacteria bacterium]|nr:MAG: hypothetical protein EAZ99_06450 [Alphaproteobacteria bacterium]
METIQQRNQRILKAIRRQAKIDQASPQAAKAALIRVGILKEDGTLRPEYDPEVSTPVAVRRR